MKTELRELKLKYRTAKTQKERDKILAETNKYADLDADQFANAMVELARETADQAEELALKSRLQDVIPVVSISYIAKNYFNKSRQWFYQKLNGNIVNGKPAKFTQDEIDTLNHALQDISRKIGSVHL